MSQRSCREPANRGARGAASAVAILLSATLAGPALAGDLYIFPNNNQSPEQQSQDKGACYVWAVDQSGYDPGTANTQAPESTDPKKGGVIRGAAGGAAVGAVAGAIAGDAGKGAAIGAAGGGMFGGMRRSSQRADQKAEKNDWRDQQQAAHDGYLRAYTACLEGKGYTVK